MFDFIGYRSLEKRGARLELRAFFLRTETELIIKSRRVIPGKLVESGFQFSYPTLAEVIRNDDDSPRSHDVHEDIQNNRIFVISW